MGKALGTATPATPVIYQPAVLGPFPWLPGGMGQPSVSLHKENCNKLSVEICGGGDGGRRRPSISAVEPLGVEDGLHALATRVCHIVTSEAIHLFHFLLIFLSFS